VDKVLPDVHRIREIIAAGTIGEVRSLTADHRQKPPDDPKHRLDTLEPGSGALLDHGIYAISFALDILGKPASIRASAKFRETGADAPVATILRYASGAIAKTLSSSDSAGPNRASVVGSKGRIDIDRVWYFPTTFGVCDNDNALVETFDASVAGRGMQFYADEAERLIASGLLNGKIMPPGNRSRSCRRWTRYARSGLHYPSESNWPPNMRRGKFALQGVSIKAGILSIDQARRVHERWNSPLSLISRDCEQPFLTELQGGTRQNRNLPCPFPSRTRPRCSRSARLRRMAERLAPVIFSAIPLPTRDMTRCDSCLSGRLRYARAACCLPAPITTARP